MVELVKRKLNSKTILEKYNIIKEIEGGLSCMTASKKHGIAKQSISNWMKENTKNL